jgi:hypothetical protein
MARDCPEWHGKTDSAAIPPRVKLRIVERGGGCCTGPCHRTFDVKLKPQFDHRPALINGGEHRESMIFAVCPECHSTRTRLDIAAKALTARIKKDRIGAKPPSQYSQGKFRVKYNRETRRFEPVLRTERETQ